MYFQVDDKFFQQRSGTAMGSSVSPIASEVYMEHFEKLVFDSVQHKPYLWLRLADDTFVVWPHGPQRLQNFLSHLNNLRRSVQFTLWK
jgi:hypothetical protein